MSDYDLEDDFTAQVDNKVLLRVAKLARPHWKWLVGFMAAIAVVSVLDSYFTYLSKQVIDTGISAHDVNAVYHLFTIYGVLLLIQAIGVFFFIFMVGQIGERVRYDLRKRMFNHLQALSLSYYSRTPVGWIMARVTSDSDRVAELMTWNLLDLTWAIINIITAAYFMILINWKLAAFVMAAIPILVIVSIRFRRLILAEFRKVRKLNSRITASYNENISGVRVVKALSREEENLKEFEHLTGDMYQASYKAAWLSALFLPIVQIISATALASVVWFSGSQIEIGLMTAGAIHAFVSYITFMMWPIQDMARVYAEMQHAIASAERIFSLLDTDPEIKDRNGAFDPGTIHGDIHFDHVDFFYEDDKPVLTNFNLSVKRGQTVALVGPTGGGKTTIVNLLCRFYEPKRGKISIGGQDYTAFSTFAIQSRIGIVLQTPHLFSGTIRENIRYGKLNATNEEVEEAARIAGAHPFIQTLEKGYDQEVGEGGGFLSVGQKQLISLARAVLARPEIFIMDEATSSVDTLTEALIQRGMEALMEGRTSFIIAHRLSTIRRADLIVVVDDGSIHEMGTHSELMRLKGKYYNLYTKQFRHDRERDYEVLRQEAEVAEE